jgi:hypothetical protein
MRRRTYNFEIDDFQFAKSNSNRHWAVTVHYEADYDDVTLDRVTHRKRDITQALSDKDIDHLTQLAREVHDEEDLDSAYDSWRDAQEG